MIDNWKIHNFEKRLNSAARLIQKRLSDANSEYVIDFKNFLFAEGLSVPRVVKYMDSMLQIGSKITKDFKQASKKDIIEYLTWLETSNYSDYSKKDLKISLKRFYRWLNNGIDPECTNWFKCTLKSKKKVMPQEILTPEEVFKLIKSFNKPRDKAFISVLYESGCRIGEILTLRLKHISFDQYGAILVVNGKTGSRRVRIVFSSNYLAQWINSHPDTTTNENHLWTYTNKPKMVSYGYMRLKIKKYALKCGICKKVNPHNFRHARATHMADKLTEAQMKEYFGWTQGSSMASVYVHLSGRDVDNAILELNGLKRKDYETQAYKPMLCACGEINPCLNNYCNRCGKPLKTETAIKIDEKKKEVNELVQALMKDPSVYEKIREMIQSQ